MPTVLLEIRDLHAYFATKDGLVKAVNGVSLSLERDSVLGLVGESASGKTVTALSILRLLPFPGEIVSGSIRYNGAELLGLKAEEMRHIRGREISMIFQDAMSSLNPVIQVGRQIEEIMLAHTGMAVGEARDMAADLLSQMGIPDARSMLDRYPFQLSGGMAQRVMMAMGLALRPTILIADEPTSNLDVTLQAEMLHRLSLLRQENSSAILLITHDLGVIAQMADQVAVMYGGFIVEQARTRDLFARPIHPYTWGLMQALPRIDSPARALTPLPGSPPRMIDPPDECPFLNRCPKAINRCRSDPRPVLQEVEEGHGVACYNPVTLEDSQLRQPTIGPGDRPSLPGREFPD